MKQVEKFEYEVDDDALAIMKEAIHNNFVNKDEQFGNARFVRNIFEKILANQANRLAKDSDMNREDLKKITATDCKL